MEGFLELKQQPLPGERQVSAGRFLLQAAPLPRTTQGAQKGCCGLWVDFPLPAPILRAVQLLGTTLQLLPTPR